jgi:hypothetical protein
MFLEIIIVIQTKFYRLKNLGKKFREGGPTPSLDLLQKPKYLGFRTNLE